MISLLRSAQPAQRVNERSTPGSAVFRGLSTPGVSFVLPEASHASSTRPAVTSPDLASLRSEIPEDSFRIVAEGLALTNHINTLADLETYSNVSEALLNRLVSERTASDGSTRLQLTSVGAAYLNRFGSEEQRHTLSRASTTRSKRPLSVVDELRRAQSSRSEMSGRSGSSQALSRLDDASVGHASGSGLNCLLDTIVQLRDNVRRRPNEDTPQTRQVEQDAQRMREALIATGAAPRDGEIDIYGGAGAQLANDLNMRFQVTERTEDGSVINHPILGESGRLVHILHTPGHFQPLWKDS